MGRRQAHPGVSTSTTSTTPPSSPSSWRPRPSSSFGPDTLAEARNRGYQPYQGNGTGTGSDRRRAERRGTAWSRSSPHGRLAICGHVARPPAPPAPVPGCVPTASRVVGERGPVGPVVPRAGRADRHRARLGGRGVPLPGLRRLRGRLLAVGMAGRPAAPPDHLHEVEGVNGVWMVGSAPAGALGLRRGRPTRVRGVAAMGAPADFDDWAGHPRRLRARTGHRHHPRPVVPGGLRRLGARATRDPRLAAARLRPGRCSSCTAPTTRRCRCSTRGCSPTPTGRPTCG